jgi:hypothetical protein
MHLVALEYVVFKDAWDATHSGPPTLFDQPFMLNTADNRFGLPPFYALHAWVWKPNPSGTFSAWNPHVGCETPGRGPAAGDHVPDPGVANALWPVYQCPIPASERVAA